MERRQGKLIIKQKDCLTVLVLHQLETNILK